MKQSTFVLMMVTAGILAWALYSQNAAPPKPVKSPPGVAFRLLFGPNETQPSTWDGNISLSEGAVSSIEGWMFAGDDAVAGQNGWKAAVRFSPAGYRETKVGIARGPMFPNGVVVLLAGVSNSTQATVHTAQGEFSLRLGDAPFGETKTFLDGRVQLSRVPVTTQLTTSPADEDFPAAIQTPGGLAVAYVSHTGDSRWSSWVGIQQPPDFDSLAKPTGGDQVMLMRFDKANRTWSAGEPVSAPHLDCIGTAVALDGKGRTWIIWSAFRDGNTDLYARYQESGKWSPEIRITSDLGTDIHPVAATDAAGRVWIAWQGFRNGSLDVLAAVQQSDRFSKEQVISFSRRSDWSPSIATAPNGDVAIAWDTYDKGDYDVYLRRLRYKGGVTLGKPLPVAATTDFEARPAIAYDAQGRLWVAYETGPRLWGKDFGTYDTSGTPLYAQQNIAVKCFRGDDAQVTADDPSTLLSQPGYRQTGRLAPGAVLPDPALARNRKPNQVLTPPAGVRNSIPRLTSGADGQVYLAYRIEDTGRSSAGPIWDERVLWFDGDRWRGPVLTPHSDAALDNRPALAALTDGGLWMIAGSDHRQYAGRGRRGALNGDLYAAEFAFDSKPQAVRLKPAPAATVAAADSGTAQEAEQIRTMREHHVLRGEFHRHTAISPDGGEDGSLEDAYRYLIDAAAMDWTGCCDHDNGTNEYSWWLEQKMTDAYHLGARFVSMFSYERSVLSPEGHRNVIFAQRGIRPLPRLPKVPDNAPFAPAPDTDMLYRYLRHFNGVTAAHQTTAVGGTDWRNNDPAVETSVEIFEGLRQSVERPDAPKAPTPTDHAGGYYPKGYAMNALGKGYRLGFESSSDHYSTHESYTMLLASEPTRQAVLDAFHKRHLYAATDNILADVHCGTHLMGDEFSVKQPPEIVVKLTGTAPFTQVHIIKDNNYVYLAEPKSKTVDFTWRDAAAEKGKTSFYYVRGEQSDGGMVWASPMWIAYQP